MSYERFKQVMEEQNTKYGADKLASASYISLNFKKMRKFFGEHPEVGEAIGDSPTLFIVAGREVIAGALMACNAVHKLRDTIEPTEFAFPIVHKAVKIFLNNQFPTTVISEEILLLISQSIICAAVDSFVQHPLVNEALKMLECFMISTDVKGETV